MCVGFLEKFLWVVVAWNKRSGCRMVSALVQPLHLLLGVVVSSHHAQQLHESNKKKPVVAQARIGMLVR